MEVARINLKLAQQNLRIQEQIAREQIAAARTQVKTAEQRYQREMELTSEGAFARIDLLATEDNLAAARAKLTEATAQREVIAAQSEVERARANLELANINLQLSDSNYRSRLEQLNSLPRDGSLVTVRAPIAGTIAQRQVTLGESFQDAGANLMSIVDNSQVFVTANIYEKDLEKIKIGQEVKLIVPSLPNRKFAARISQIAPLVEAGNRVIPVRATIDNHNEQLKPGMFAQLEIVTEKTAKPILFIPTSAIVEVQGQQIIYLENGNNVYQPIEVTFGKSFGDNIQVKNGLFAGDRVVVEGRNNAVRSISQK